jgi:hypothetical protein
MSATRSSKNGEIEWERVHPSDLVMVEQLQERIAAAASDAERERLQTRLHRLFALLETKPPGRPRVLSPEQEAEYRRAIGGLGHATRRTVQNRVNSAHALNLLCDGPLATVSESNPWRWLLRPNRDGVAESRKAIMYQLGRVRHAEALKVFASALCERRPTAQAAVRMLRCWRGRFDSMLVMRLAESDDHLMPTLETLDLDYAELARTSIARSDAEEKPLMAGLTD